METAVWSMREELKHYPTPFISSGLTEMGPYGEGRENA